jgi:broad specificity phosphatase PhoE
MTTIYLLRHGEADYEPVRERRWPGSMAELAGLSERGRQEAAAAAAALAGVGATALVSSPYTRTMQTSGIVACHLGLSVEVDFGLHEWVPDDTFGWLTHAEVREFMTEFEASGGEWRTASVGRGNLCPRSGSGPRPPWASRPAGCEAAAQRTAGRRPPVG